MGFSHVDGLENARENRRKVYCKKTSTFLSSAFGHLTVHIRANGQACSSKKLIASTLSIHAPQNPASSLFQRIATEEMYIAFVKKHVVVLLSLSCLDYNASLIGSIYVRYMLEVYGTNRSMIRFGAYSNSTYMNVNF